MEALAFILIMLIIMMDIPGLSASVRTDMKASVIF